MDRNRKIKAQGRRRNEENCWPKADYCEACNRLRPMRQPRNHSKIDHRCCLQASEGKDEVVVDKRPQVKHCPCD